MKAVATQPVLSEASTPAEQPPKPRFRGWLHQIAFFVAVPAGVILVSVAHTTAARVTAAIYALSLAGLYGSSAAYHRLPWSRRALRRMKSLDHSMIFLLIAGTYTPLSVFVLRRPWSLVFLSAVWAGAAAGVVLKLVKIDGLGGVSGALYIVLGWLAILITPQIVRGLSPVAVGLLLAGGILYTTGAIVLRRRRPDPVPATFGYHEIWHSMVVGASACHYAGILLMVLAARPVGG
jgi:hemolysin III